MAFQKHLGVTNLGTRVAIINLRLPETDFALVVETESLPPRYQDAFVELINGQAQSTNELLVNLLSRHRFPSGENMLQALHANGYLHRVLIDNIQMFVDTSGKKMDLRAIVDAVDTTDPSVNDTPLSEQTAQVSDEEAAAIIAQSMSEVVAPVKTEEVSSSNEVAALSEAVALLQDTVAAMHKDLLSIKPRKVGRPPKSEKGAK